MLVGDTVSIFRAIINFIYMTKNYQPILNYQVKAYHTHKNLIWLIIDYCLMGNKGYKSPTKSSLLAFYSEYHF